MFWFEEIAIKHIASKRNTKNRLEQQPNANPIFRFDMLRSAGLNTRRWTAYLNVESVWKSKRTAFDHMKIFVHFVTLSCSFDAGFHPIVERIRQKNKFNGFYGWDHKTTVASTQISVCTNKRTEIHFQFCSIHFMCDLFRRADCFNAKNTRSDETWRANITKREEKVLNFGVRSSLA